MGETLFATDELSLYTMSLIAGAVIVCLALLYWILRRRGHMAFMRGGANRQPRLAVLDAAAVDARRRLVLIRRDDVEHLILIGGPSDLVVESGIKRTAATPQPEKAKAPAAQRPPTRSAKPQPIPKQPAKSPEQSPRETVTPPPRAEAKPEPARPARPETAERKQPEEPVAARAATAAAVSAAATVPNGQHRPKAEPAREATAPVRVPERPAANPRQATPETPRQDAAQTATPEKPPAEPVEKQAPAEPSSDSEAIKTEFEDALDAARELVMPATTPAGEAPPAPDPEMNYAHAVSQPAKPQTQTAAAAAPAKPPAEPETARSAATPQQNVSAEDLIADFDRVLEAEMNKSDADQLPPTAGKQPEAGEDAENGASLEDEMKKLLGDLSAKQ